MDTMPPCAVIFLVTHDNFGSHPLSGVLIEQTCACSPSVCEWRMTENMRRALLLVLLLISVLNFSAAFPMEPLQKVYESFEMGINPKHIIKTCFIEKNNNNWCNAFVVHLPDTSTGPTITSTAVRKCNAWKLTGESCVLWWDTIRPISSNVEYYSCADVHRTWGWAVLDSVWEERILLTQRNRAVTVRDASRLLETQRDRRNEIYIYSYIQIQRNVYTSIVHIPKHEKHPVSVRKDNLFLICLYTYIYVYFLWLSFLKILHEFALLYIKHSTHF